MPPPPAHSLNAPIAAPPSNIARRLIDTGRWWVDGNRALIDRADPDERVSGRSRLLCAGLAELALACYRALGGTKRSESVASAAATLSMLTKIDDQVIDNLAFHGGAASDRDRVEARTRAYLEPTLRSIIDAAPALDEGRCHLAARLGADLRGLAASPDRLERLLELIRFGWDVQVRAVRNLSADPAEVSRLEIERTTAQISGAWLLMITMVGSLPSDARRSLTAAEERAFYEWGAWIQRADALSDFHKDVADGLGSSLPLFLLHEDAPGTYRGAIARADTDALYRAIADAGIDRRLMPGNRVLVGLGNHLGELGEVPALLGWIHGFLTYRYLADPGSARTPRDPLFAPFVSEPSDWADYLEAIVAGS